MNPDVNLKGKRVRLLTELPVLVEATVEADEPNGYVLRLDPSTAEIQERSDTGPAVVARYYHRLDIENAADANLTWLGRVHAHNIREVME